MPKTQEELCQIKNEYESLSNKLKELTEDELVLVTGGTEIGWDWLYERTIDDYHQSDTELGNKKPIEQ